MCGLNDIVSFLVPVSTTRLDPVICTLHLPFTQSLLYSVLPIFHLKLFIWARSLGKYNIFIDSIDKVKLKDSANKIQKQRSSVSILFNFTLSQLRIFVLNG